MIVMSYLIAIEIEKEFGIDNEFAASAIGSIVFVVRPNASVRRLPPHAARLGF